jgi:hypothetical protein
MFIVLFFCSIDCINSKIKKKKKKKKKKKYLPQVDEILKAVLFPALYKFYFIWVTQSYTLAQNTLEA